MSIQSTIRIRRASAIAVLLESIPDLPNKLLGTLMDLIAESESSKFASKFDNFTVSDYDPD